MKIKSSNGLLYIDLTRDKLFFLASNPNKQPTSITNANDFWCDRQTDCTKSESCLLPFENPTKADAVPASLPKRF